jgi:dienelactone hydrolase
LPGRLSGAALLLMASSAWAAPAQVSVSDLVETASLGGLAVSPDGRRVSVRVDRADVEANRYGLDWFAIDIGSGRRQLLGDGGEAIYVDPGLVEPGEAIWSADGTTIYFRALGDGAIGIWSARVDGTGSRPILVKEANILSLAKGDGGGLVYAVGAPRADVLRAERSEYREGVRVDSSVDLAQSLMRGGWVEGRLAAQRLAGRWFERRGLLGGMPRRRVRFDPVHESETILGTATATGVREGPVRPDMDRVARAGDGSEARAGVVDGKATLSVVRGGKERICAAEACRGRPIGWIAWRPGRAELLFAVRDAHLRDQLFLWDIRQDRVRHVAGADGTLSGGGFNRNLPCAVGLADLICIGEGPVSPQRLVAIDLESGRSRDLFDPNRALRAKRMPRVRRLEWTSGTGRAATGVLLTAPGTGDARRPLFLTYYRCLGFLKGGEGGEWPLASLVDAGFSVACINAVSSGESQDALQSYRDAQSAIEALVQMLGREGVIDPRRIGMGGFSFGSEVTMWMLTRTRLLGAASIASPQIEPAYYWINAMRGRDQPALLANVWGIGPPGTTEERWALVSPTASADRIDAPLLMQLSEQEARLDPELHARLSRSGVAAELYAFPDEAHFKVQPVHQWHAMTRNLDWFRYWMLGAVDGDPAKSGQYESWSGLRERGPEPLLAP